jgi:hypothetical protein
MVDSGGAAATAMISSATEQGFYMKRAIDLGKFGKSSFFYLCSNCGCMLIT